MLIIPVIDLSHGLVVHAKQGLRNSYQPITSVISASAEPEAVISSFLELYPFKIIYIADLDAIQGTGSHRELIIELALRYKQCEFWLDTGIKAIQNHQAIFQTNNIKLILGSENRLSEESLSTFIKNNPDLLLSLDFKNTELIENAYLLQKPSLWPKQIIIMMLDRVGSNKGIDMSHLNKIIQLGNNNDFYAAGGVKNIDDLNQLKSSTSIKGVLLATALHNGAITKENLESFLQN
jgi:phosphoribosylformimino-5-aminoimidazole carboxamide ribotide isomerase